MFLPAELSRASISVGAPLKPINQLASQKPDVLQDSAVKQNTTLDSLPDQNSDFEGKVDLCIRFMTVALLLYIQYKLTSHWECFCLQYCYLNGGCNDVNNELACQL